MTKLITFCVFIATTFAVNAQDKKPTKEETISWLQEKLEKSLEFRYRPNYRYFIQNNQMVVANPYSDTTIPIPKIKSIHISECEIQIEVLIPSSQWSKDQFSTITIILPTGITLKNVEEGRVFKYNDLEISYIFNQKEYKFDSYQLSIIQKEENLSQRVQKALIQLSTFCPKQKETF